MNFLVSDRFEYRQSVIRGLLESRIPGLAVVTAAADLEGTLRRAIIALGCSPNCALNKRMQRTSGLRKYAALWKLEVAPRFGKTLDQVVCNWESFVNVTYKLRHQLVHGAISRVGKDYAVLRTEEIMAVTKSIVVYCDLCGFDLYTRLPVRLKALTGFDADGKFLGIGVGSSVSIKTKIVPK